MKNTKNGQIFLIFLIILFFCLLCLMILLQRNLKEEEQNNINISVAQDEKPKTIEEVIRKYESEYIKEENNKIYVKFSKNLYDENGKSNEKFFYDMANELIQFFENTTFYVIDEEKKIEINVQFDYEIEKHKIIINNIENFYENTNGKSYVEVEKSELVKPSALYASNYYLETLTMNQMFLTSIEEDLTDEKGLASGYKSYNDNTIRIKLAPNKSVMNIIFSDDYKDSILTDVEAGDSLSQIYELHNDNTFGNLDKGYLGYRSNNLYYFFYKDEISVYGYSYRRNKVFEELLIEYIENKDLDKFITTLSNKMLSYDVLEYEPDSKKATMIFPTRGIEIKIEDNNPKGIKLYSNYYFTDTTKELVKNGLISYSAEDLVEKYEIQRRERNN